MFLGLLQPSRRIVFRRPCFPSSLIASAFVSSSSVYILFLVPAFLSPIDFQIPPLLRPFGFCFDDLICPLRPPLL